ncbi:hypothetical protein Ciccas_013179 [Cichlidogyrus casuarinus]|uniref:Neurotransmitter-gated ion-channel ligand-binding domain-containing protein n=1 Tax=Cichlidogyrus casuarinus TaxID=1844966 RepID=A0ABD2PM16_9PLAT
MTYFPFDSQHCELHFGSTSLDDTELDLNFWRQKDYFQNSTVKDEYEFPYIDMKKFMPSNEWKTDGEDEIHVPAPRRM